MAPDHPLTARLKAGPIAGAAALLGSALFAFGVALFAYAGTYARYWADDYCYSATLKQDGLFRGLADWYTTSGNRLSALAMVGLSDLFGPHAIRLVPLAVLVFWAAAWMFFLWQASRALGWRTPPYWLALLALVQVFFNALLAPDRLQTVYWRMGTYHYSLPVPVLLANLGLIIAFRRSRGRWGAGLLLVSGFLGFFAAGLSETFAALQTAILALAMLGLLALLRGPDRARQRWQGLRLLAAPLAGSLLMMLVMILAPANSWRQAVLPPPKNLLLILPYSLRYTLDFIRYTLRGQLTPFLVYAALAAALALLVVPAELRLKRRALFLGAGISLLVMVALIFSSFAPSSYAGLAYPAGRALMPGSFILLLGLGAAAGFLALGVRSAAPTRWQPWLAAAALIVLVGGSLYPLRSVASFRRDVAQLAPRAARWDARDAQIETSIRGGSLDLQVKQTDVVQTLGDIGPDPHNWINACAAVFYGARSITASP